jgi:hypothetical protein
MIGTGDLFFPDNNEMKKIAFIDIRLPYILSQLQHQADRWRLPPAHRDQRLHGRREVRPVRNSLKLRGAIPLQIKYRSVKGLGAASGGYRYWCVLVGNMAGMHA